MRNPPNRRQFLFSLAALTGAAIIPGLSACKPVRPLQVAIHPWIGYETLRLARELKWLGSEVALIETKDLNETGMALQTGKVDAGCITLDEVIRLRSEGIPVSVAMIFDVSAGADVVLVRPTIRKLSEIKGKRIGIEPGALGGLILQKLLEAAGLPQSAITIVNCPPEKQLEAWNKKEVDAVITYEPTATLLQRAGAERLYDSRQMPEFIFDVLAVRMDRVGDQDEQLESLITAHFRGLEHLQRNRHDAIYRYAGYQGISPQEIQQALAGIGIPTLIANRSYFSGNDRRLEKAAAEIQNYMLKHDQIKRADSLNDLLVSTWLPRD